MTPLEQPIVRDEKGQGLIEMVISLTVLSVAISALLAVMTAGALSVQRAGAVGTSATLADKQLEIYRTISYTNIGLDTTTVPSSGSDPYNTGHTSDANIPVATGQVTASTHCVSPMPVECIAVQTVTGPDRRSYRVDTYITSVQPTGTYTGRPLKQVNVIVRDASKPTLPILARNASTFDSSSNATG